MSVLNENTIIGASGAGGDYEIEQSLRFNDDDNAYLSRTPSSAGNRRTFTYSVWIKRGNLGTQQRFFSAASASNNEFHINFYQDKIHMWNYVGSTPYPEFKTTQLFRDPSSWYHIVASVDSTNSTANDRMRLYVNGVRITAFDTSNNPDLNYQFLVNENNIQHTIGTRPVAYTQPMDGYMGEINFIDGQALTPDSFGETGDYGEWKPKAYAGTYGTNGFYLPFEQDYSVEGFSTVTYEATQANQYIGGTGFQPDFIWFKNRTRSSPHRLVDAVRGLPNMLMTNTTGVEATAAADGTMVRTVTGFAPDGFTLGVDDGGYRVNSSTGDDIVAWSWDMGGTTASNTSGSITSSVRANTAYGQSIVSYTGTGSAATIGHGLASAPNLIISKKRDAAASWMVYHSALGATKYILLSSSNAEGTSNGPWNDTNPTSTVYSVRDSGGVNTSGASYIAYCFSDVANYSKFGSYSGNGSTTGPVVTLGFSPAFVMIKRTDTGGNGWVMLDNTRNPFGNFDNHLEANTSAAETDNTGDGVMPSSTGFQLTNTYAGMNASGGTYIYAAFADTREYAYWYDQSGNNNDWTSEGGLTESDVMLDSPTNNFATINPLAKDSSVILQEGNLLFYRAANMTRPALSTIGLGSTQKWYCEFHERSGTNIYAGVQWEGTNVNTYPHAVGTYAYVANADGGYYQNGSYTSFNSSMTSGDKIRSIAYDAATGKMWIGANGTFSGNPAAGSGELLTVPSAYRHQMYFVGAKDNASATTAGIANFGQDSSFAGNKTAQGNQDANSVGDFYYAPPTGFLALCTKSLPSVDVIPSENFNTVTWTGNGSARSITTGVDTDLVWTKARNQTYDHNLFDSVRGALKKISSNSTVAESSMTNSVTAFNTDGFTLGDTAQVNLNGGTFVAWNWKAGGTAVSNTNGTITSSVSANTAAGFSIVADEADGNANSRGHGLSSAPEMIIRKSRDSARNWAVWHKDLTANYALEGLNTTGAQVSGGNPSKYFRDINSTTFSVGDDVSVNANGDSYISYCFHSVESYSKVGSYTGNGSATDGTFVHCGFKPAWVMVKRTDASGDDWHMMDIARSPFNLITNRLKANSSDAEATNDTMIDSVSNGFKLRNASGARNASGGTYIFLAFAESPFKFSNAR